MSDYVMKTNAAAKYLGVSRSTLTNWIRQGTLTPGVTPGGHYRFSRKMLDDFMLEQGMELPRETPSRILLIDDDPAFHEIITEALEIFTNYELKSAMDGMQGAMMIGSWKPDLILLDIRMPKMDGHALLKLIRDNPETAESNVIIASAHLSPDLIASLNSLEPDAVLEKPVRIAKLIAAMQKFIHLPLA